MVVSEKTADVNQPPRKSPHGWGHLNSQTPEGHKGDFALTESVLTNINIISGLFVYAEDFITDQCLSTDGHTQQQSVLPLLISLHYLYFYFILRFVSLLDCFPHSSEACTAAEITPTPICPCKFYFRAHPSPSTPVSPSILIHHCTTSIPFPPIHKKICFHPHLYSNQPTQYGLNSYEKVY